MKFHSILIRDFVLASLVATILLGGGSAAVGLDTSLSSEEQHQLENHQLHLLQQQHHHQQQRHHLEDIQSWNLHLERQRGHRLLQEDGDGDNVNDEEEEQQDTTGDDDDVTPDITTPPAPYTIKRKKPKNHIPFAGGDTTHGMMIDAGSQGTRLHIYEWDKRFLLDEDDLLAVAHGKKLSIPTSNSRWTDKYTPGLDVFAYHKDPHDLKHALKKYLGPLLDFAKQVLKDKEDQWDTYPIFLKATGGMRTLPKKDRVRLIAAIRKLFHSKKFNPFDFKDEQARVISGEEEAIYGWVGVNFAMGTLIDASMGSGVGKNPKLSYGMLEMGGASTQIAFFENHGDIMADLFKLQLGGARHWNVYTHSYLYFGINGAWSRLNAQLHGLGTNVNPCLPVGSGINFTSWVTLNDEGVFLPRSAPESIPYTLTMVNDEASPDFAACSHQAYELLREESNKDWCDFEMDGSCAFAGIYQPPLPDRNAAIDEFIATSNFVDVFNFLDLGDRATIARIGQVAEKVCSLTWSELKEYNDNLVNPIKNDDDDTLSQMCFRSIFVYHLLSSGWGFGDNYVMTVADVLNGQKLGWALGCMLYEINTLPWDFHPELLYRGPSLFLITLYVIIGILGGSIVGFALAMRMSKKFNQRVRQSTIFQKTPLAKNNFLRKSLALPADYRLDELNSLYEQDEKQAESENVPLRSTGSKYT